jgi:hypothetical protein
MRNESRLTSVSLNFNPFDLSHAASERLIKRARIAISPIPIACRRPLLRSRVVSFKKSRVNPIIQNAPSAVEVSSILAC